MGVGCFIENEVCQSVCNWMHKFGFSGILFLGNGERHFLIYEREWRGGRILLMNDESEEFFGRNVFRDKCRRCNDIPYCAVISRGRMDSTG